MRGPAPLRALAAIQIGFLLAACQHTIVPDVDRIELHRSATQRLVLQNTGAQPLAVEPLEGVRPALEIAPGEEATIGFVVATVAEAEQAPDQPWLVPVPGTETNTVIMIEPEGYLQPTASDLVFRVRSEPDADQERRLSLLCAPDGWEAAPAPAAAHPVDLARPPLPGIPVPICPSTAG